MNAREIRAGFNRGEFFLEYLPMLNLATERCVGAEALTRWRCDAEVLHPFSFEALHRDISLTGRITYWVIETLAAELGAWLRAHADVHVSFNVPPTIVGRGGIDHAIRRAALLDLAGQLIIEITEHGLIDEIGAAAIEKGRVAGLRLAVDDMTLTRSDASLLVFSRLSIDFVKLPKQFVDGLHDGNADAAALATLLWTTSAQVIAEGIETPEQFALLRRLGVPLGQGFLFSRPLPAAAFLAYHASKNL